MQQKPKEIQGTKKEEIEAKTSAREKPYLIQKEDMSVDRSQLNVLFPRLC